MRKTVSNLILLTLCCALPIALVWSLDYKAVVRFARFGNYWFSAAIGGAFLYFAITAIGGAGRSAVIGWLRKYRWGLLLACVLAVYLQINEPHSPKILYDEDVICGVAYQMHYERVAAQPVKAHYFNGRLTVTSSFIDKRPVFFPFVLSTIHDLTGYRVANVYVLNALLGFSLLALLYVWAVPITGTHGAAAGLLLLCTLPLLAQCATGAGFEVMNLCLIVAFALAARRYLGRAGTDGLNLLICVALMLSITRYESVLYLFALALVVVIKWARERRITMTFFSVISPLFLVSSLLSNRVFLGNEGFLQAHNDAEFIAFSNLSGNLESAVYYLFSLPWVTQTNSIFLSLIGVVSILFVLVHYLPKLAKWRGLDDSTLVFLSVLSVAFVTTLIGLLENWGQWSDPMASRFSLPFHLVLVMSFVGVLPLFFKQTPVPMFVAIVPACWVMFFTAQQSARHEMTSSLPASHAAVFFRDWANENATMRDLIVDESATGIILEEHPCVSPIVFASDPWKLNALVEAGLYDRVYAFERLCYDEKTGLWAPANPIFSIPMEVKRQKVAELRLNENILERISLVTHVDDPEADKHQCPADAEGRAKWLLSILP